MGITTFITVLTLVVAVATVAMFLWYRRVRARNPEKYVKLVYFSSGYALGTSVVVLAQLAAPGIFAALRATGH